MKYRSKPAEATCVDAFQWTGGPDQTEDPEWICTLLRDEDAQIVRIRNHLALVIYTVEAWVLAAPSDWVALAEDGGISVYTPEEFAAMYELV